MRREHRAVAPARLPQRAQAPGDASQGRLSVAHTGSLLEPAGVAQRLAALAQAGHRRRTALAQQARDGGDRLGVRGALVLAAARRQAPP